jgi:hypothetical protein
MDRHLRAPAHACHAGGGRAGDRARAPPSGRRATSCTRWKNLQVEPALTCRWNDLLRVAMRDGRLEVEATPSPAVLERLGRGKLAELEIENAAERFWQVHAIRPQGMMGGGVVGGPVPVAPGRVVRVLPVVPRPPQARRNAVDFVATTRIRREGEQPAAYSVMLLGNTFRLNGRVTGDDGKALQIDFRSYADKSNVTLIVRELMRGPPRAGDRVGRHEH